MVIRKMYSDRIRPFYNQTLIKVIAGVRRCGKSVLLEQIQNDLLSDGANPEVITHINLELMDNKHLRDCDCLYQTIVERLVPNVLNYVFLDEIQLALEFEDVVNSLQSKGNVSVFMTGSNSKLLAGELAT